MLREEPELWEVEREGEVVVLRPVLPVLRLLPVVGREVLVPLLRELREVPLDTVPREGVRPVLTEPPRLPPRVVTSRGVTKPLPRRVVLL